MESPSADHSVQQLPLSLDRVELKDFLSGGFGTPPQAVAAYLYVIDNKI